MTAKTLLLAGGALLASASAASASGFQVNLGGQKNNGMGGVGVGLSLDQAAMFYNPGALALVRRNGVMLGVNAAFARVSFRSANGGPQRGLEDQPVVTPFNLYASFGPAEGKFRAGIAVYTPYGSSLSYGSNWEGRYSLTEITLRAIYVQPTASYAITPQLSVGAGLTILVGGSVNLQRDVAFPSVPSGDGQIELDGQAKTKFGYNAGVFFKPSDKLSGSGGKNQVIEIFYYLREFQQPNPYAPARYYYDPKKRRIYKATRELNPATDKILHGPYKKLQNNQTLETGFFALGTRHLRWEKFGRDGVLLAKTHYEMGFPRDANISYYDNGRTLLKEVVPYVNGKLEGDYARFLADGQRDWSGQFENGRRVGVWTKYWGFRNRHRYEYQYPESGYDPEVTEPELIKEYNRNATLIFDKEKGLDKRGQPEAEDRPGQRRPVSRGGK